MPKLRFRIAISLDGYTRRPRRRASTTRWGSVGAAPRLGRRARRVARGARARGRRGQREHRGGRGGADQHRRDDHGPEHVRRRPGPWDSDHAMDRMVGRQPAVPPSGLRAHATPPRAAGARGRNDLHLRHRRHRVGAGPGAAAAGGRTSRSPAGRRRAAVPQRRAGGRDGAPPRADPARRGRATVRRRPRPARSPARPQHRRPGRHPPQVRERIQGADAPGPGHA